MERSNHWARASSYRGRYASSANNRVKPVEHCLEQQSRHKQIEPDTVVNQRSFRERRQDQRSDSPRTLSAGVEQGEEGGDAARVHLACEALLQFLPGESTISGDFAKNQTMPIDLANGSRSEVGRPLPGRLEWSVASLESMQRAGSTLRPSRCILHGLASSGESCRRDDLIWLSR